MRKSLEQTLQFAQGRGILRVYWKESTDHRRKRSRNDGKADPDAQRIYDYIAETIREQGYPPSVREIGDAVGLKSPSTVHFHLKHLAELGVIGKEAGKGRAITLTNPLPREDQVPVVGSVAAGSPILAQECIEDYLTFEHRRAAGRVLRAARAGRVDDQRGHSAG